MGTVDLHCDTMLHLIDQPKLKLKKKMSVDIHKLKAGNGVAHRKSHVDFKLWR